MDTICVELSLGIPSEFRAYIHKVDMVDIGLGLLGRAPDVAHVHVQERGENH